MLQAEMSLIYGHTLRLAIGFTVHLLGWLCTGVAGWITYHLLGVPIDFDDALAIEALLAAASAVAFLVPVNAGVQEAGYAGLGAIFGVAPELSLAVSLVRRARDLGTRRANPADLAIDRNAAPSHDPLSVHMRGSRPGVGVPGSRRAAMPFLTGPLCGRAPCGRTRGPVAGLDALRWRP
jgi:hypothetical protein